jgi:hypothetical protein
MQKTVNKKLDATQVKMDETKEDMRVDREKMKAEMHA